MHDEMIETVDEELEMEIDDNRLSDLLENMPERRSQDTIDRHTYFRELLRLQKELIKLQNWVVHQNLKLVVLFEGRDAAGKGGVIKRVTQRLNPRICKVVALPAPSERERTQWYFQRYVAHLPAAGELVLFNRSWYNRAGVEPVMGFCTPQEHEDFLRDAPTFEQMQEEAHTEIVKLWLDISKKEQAVRLERRREDPLKVLKVSSLDGEAQKRWKDYSKARNEMLLRTSTAIAPWYCVHTDHKKEARLNVIRHILHELAPGHIRQDVPPPDPAILFEFEESALTDGRLEK
jgi:polyphosphate kinase 2